MNNYLKAAGDYIKGLRLLDFSLLMTLMLLVVHAPGVFQVRPVTQALCIAGIIFYRWIGRSPWLWLIISAVLAWGHSVFWFAIDNHMYLMNYWTLAISICLFSKNPSAYLAINGRLLIGLCFLFATIWKAVKIEFVNGSFFTYLLLGGDVRFESFSMLLTGISPDVLEFNREMINELRNNPGVRESALEVPPRVRYVALMLTWWTLIVEGLIAVLYLWHRPSQTSGYRDIILGIFIITTYPVASVIAFAWLLISMGVAQLKRFSDKIKWFYVVLFLVLSYFSPQAIHMAERLWNLLTL